MANRDVVVDGVRLAYRDSGTGEAVVLVHGTPSTSDEWRDVAPRLEAAGYRVITYDLLGYGRSERPVDRDTSVAGQAVLLERLLTVLGLDDAAVVGHDIGGATALRLALDHPQRVRRLMLLDTVSYDSWPSETWRDIIDHHLADYHGLPAEEFDALLTRQLEMTVSDPARMSGEVLDAYLAPHRSALGRTSFFEHQVRHYDSRYTEELTGRLGDLGVPVRILWGEDDRWQPLHYARRLAADIPGAELRLVPGAGHFVMEDAPDRVTEEILDCLGAN